MLGVKARIPRLTLLGRAVVLIGGELVFNAICWIAAGIILSQGDGLLGLALLAWTIGLRHGLDADHISAIDNATRQLVSIGQLPITCGLFFSLGHSTIVIVVNIALAISVDIYDKLDGVGAVGGIVGTAVSASFLFLIASINIYFLTKALKSRKESKRCQRLGLPEEPAAQGIQGGGYLVRIIAPVLKAVDKSWKMYPVGVLFGFGFDTASSIALLAISAIAQRGPDGDSINHGKIVILPFLFTAGMSLVDSLDSVLMLYAYALPSTSSPEGKLAFYCDSVEEAGEEDNTRTQLNHQEGAEPERAYSLPRVSSLNQGNVETDSHVQILDDEDDKRQCSMGCEQPADDEPMPSDCTESSTSPQRQEVIETKLQVMSSLSITLTLLSIIVALSISLIEIMGLIDDNCDSCQAAANDPDGGGLAGSWWRFWDAVNDASGYVGAGIVGVFVFVLAVFWGGRWIWRRVGRRSNEEEVV